MLRAGGSRGGRRRGATAGAVLAVFALGAVLASPAQPVVPGANGKLAFVDANANIAVMNPDGWADGPDRQQRRRRRRRRSRMVPGRRADRLPREHEAGAPDIFVMNADGSNVVNLTNDAALDDFPAWSPDGLRIAYATAPDSPASSTSRSINANGSGKVNLTNSPCHRGRRPGLVTCRTADRVHDGPRWQQRDLHDRPERRDSRPTSPRIPGNDNTPAWSPDGQKLAFESERDGNSELYVMNADGSGQTNLTNSPRADRWAAWSPDGQKIAFMTDRDVPNAFDIYVMDAGAPGRRG